MNWTFPLCPSGPDYKIDWDALQDCFPILRMLENVPQNPRFHKEGNVLNHTKLVVQALVEDAEWIDLEERKRSVLFLATLFHDIGKIEKTKDEGGIVSKGHASAGARMVREILSSYKEKGAYPAPWYIREQVANYVMLHMVPYFLIDKPDPLYTVTAASQVIENKMLRILCKADSKGRISDTYDSALESIELYESFCEENFCLVYPRKFKSDNARFRYFFEHTGHPNLDRYEKTKGTAYMMSGVAGAGKDTFLNTFHDVRSISLDGIRTELKVKPLDKSGRGRVLNLAKERCREEMRKKNDFSFNATNLSKQNRAKWTRLFRKYGYRIEIIYIEPDFNTILKQNKNREDSIPESAVRNMFKFLDVPSLLECHDITYKTYE